MSESPIKTNIFGSREYLSTIRSWVNKPDKATIAKPIDTKKYKSSVDLSITSFTNKEDVKTIQAFEIPKKDAITNEGKTLLSVNLSAEESVLLSNDESSFLRSLKFKKPITNPNRLKNINGINKLLSESSMIIPTATGPRTTPNCHPASNLAKPDVLFVVSVISAILPPAEGLTALPSKPFINLAQINKTKSNVKENGYI